MTTKEVNIDLNYNFDAKEALSALLAFLSKKDLAGLAFFQAVEVETVGVPHLDEQADRTRVLRVTTENLDSEDASRVVKSVVDKVEKLSLGTPTIASLSNFAVKKYFPQAIFG